MHRTTYTQYSHVIVNPNKTNTKWGDTIKQIKVNDAGEHKKSQVSTGRPYHDSVC